MRRSVEYMKGLTHSEADIEKLISEFLAREIPSISGIFSQKNAGFYSPRWYCFDSFSAHTVYLDDFLYATAEHAYHAGKYEDEKIVHAIRNASSAHEAKKIGSDPSQKDKRRPDWPVARVPRMRRIIRAKHAQHEHVQKCLKQSVGLVIIEDSPTDSFWGRGPDWNGENMLGKLWMELRDELY
ncbi:NADAR family protein [bacterium]|nr:NADAR family protein [bacterium]